MTESDVACKQISGIRFHNIDRRCLSFERIARGLRDGLTVLMSSLSLAVPTTSRIRMKQPRMRHFGDETAHEGDVIQMSSTFQINRLIQ